MPHSQINDNTGTSSRPSSYSNIVNSPSKKQAILLPYEEDTTLIEYIVAIGRMIGPEKILSASKISNKRICVYLNSEKTANNFVEDHQHITIQDKQIMVRKLVSTSRKITLSNVHPCIPNSILLDQLRKFNIKPTSAIHNLHVNLTSKNIPQEELAHYAHIKSFRRAIYIENSVNLDIPDSFIIIYDNETYRIFINDGESKCHLCGENNHHASQCPKPNDIHPLELQSHISVHPTSELDETTFQDKIRKARQVRDGQNNETSEIINTDSPTNIKITEDNSKLPNQENHEKSTPMEITTISTKRPLPSNGSDISSPSIINPSPKKSKSQEHKQLSTLPSGIKTAIQEFASSEANIHNIPSLDLEEYIEELLASKSTNIHVKDYTENCDQFLDTLALLRLNIKHKGTKNRITRNINHLRPQLAQEDSENSKLPLQDDDSDQDESSQW